MYSTSVSFMLRSLSNFAVTAIITKKQASKASNKPQIADTTNNTQDSDTNLFSSFPTEITTQELLWREIRASHCLEMVKLSHRISSYVSVSILSVMFCNELFRLNLNLFFRIFNQAQKVRSKIREIDSQYFCVWLEIREKRQSFHTTVAHMYCLFSNFLDWGRFKDN